MKSLIALCTALLVDTGRLCSVETARDLITIKSRAQHEGVSFFTITLPEFASEFERALEAGQVDSTFFSGWKKRGCLPAFLRGFTSLVFGTDGVILEVPDANAVFCIRQISRVLKKVRLACSSERAVRAFHRFAETEAALPDAFDATVDRHRHFVDVANLLWSSVFGPEFNTFGLVPKHGPGATAEGISGNAKYPLKSWHERLERSFPVTEYYFTSVNHMLCDHHGLRKLDMIAAPDELPVRVIQVPKTLKAPRIIAIEPVCMQYTQQAVARWIMDMIQRHELTRSVIRFNDQSVNQQVAIRASSDRSFSTIDLSDASDRVPLVMVQHMLGSVPSLLAAIEDCRSRRAQLPDGQVLTLKKFASMGSALCFPIESMYFYTIIVHAILWKHGLTPTRKRILKVAKRVYVFGDDIIVPRHETDTVLEALAYYNCKVNTTKSFWRGNFRESCGADAFRGVNVTPIYVRETCPSDRRSTTALASWVATSNLFHEVGLWHTADYMKNVVEGILGELPVLTKTSPGLGWVSYLGIPSTYRMCKNLHKPIVRTYKLRASKQKDNLEGYPALLKYFLNKRHQEIDATLRPMTADKKHLMFSARCGTVSRKRHWVSAA